MIATEDKNNIVYEIDCRNCNTVYFSESKESLKSHSHLSDLENCVASLENCVASQKKRCSKSRKLFREMVR